MKWERRVTVGKNMRAIFYIKVEKHQSHRIVQREPVCNGFRQKCLLKIAVHSFQCNVVGP
jgi:hypothetical protein